MNLIADSGIMGIGRVLKEGRGAMGPDPIAPLKRGVSCQTGHDYKCNFLFLALPLLK